MAALTGAAAGRPFRILFFLFHAGYLRHYAEPVRILARQGHIVHLAFTQTEKDPGDAALVERLAAECPTVTYGRAASRSYLDGWRRTSTLVRAFTDLSRYVDPRYADAPALRARMAKKIRLQVLSGKADPISSRILVHAVEALSARSDARLARRLRRLLGALESAIPTSRRITRSIADFAPDVVLATPVVEYASPQVDYLKTARHLGIPCAACIASWDNLTNKGLLRVVPDRVLVWNEIQRDELGEMHGVGPERVVVTGAQKFDEWFERRPSSTASEFCARVGLPADRPFVLYLCSSWFIAPDEVSFVRRWLEGIRASDDPRLADLPVLVRPHPQNGRQWDGVDLSDLGPVSVWPAGGAQPDAGDRRADFFDSLAHSAAVVGVNTSAMIEAAIVGKPVFTLLDPQFAGTQEGTLHFHYLLRENGGFLQVARTPQEHLEQLAEQLARGEAEAERLQEFIRRFTRPHGLDVAAAPLVAQAIVDLAAVEPTAERTTMPTRSLRMLLWIPSVLATASTLVGAVIHPFRKRAPKPPAAQAG
jgi:hypothetical protein